MVWIFYYFYCIKNEFKLTKYFISLYYLIISYSFYSYNYIYITIILSILSISLDSLYFSLKV
jgi:hypothetical protein